MVVTSRRQKPMSEHEYSGTLNHPYYLPIAAGWIVGYFRTKRFNLTLDYMGEQMPKPISGPGYRKVEKGDTPNLYNLLAASNVVKVKLKDLFAVADLGSLALQSEEETRGRRLTPDECETILEQLLTGYLAKLDKS